MKVLKCWRDSSVVGTTTATCWPDMATAKAARSATSVLPKPTSPQTSRSMTLARGQVVEHGVDGRQLILGLLVGEARRELLVERPAGCSIGGAVEQLALRRDLDELLRHVADALLEPALLGLPGDAAELVELDDGVRAIARSAARCSRPAGRAWCCRRTRSRRSRAARPATSMVLRPRKRPMPWSTCTTRSPAARLAASVSASDAFLRLCGRSRRSPRMSCSDRTSMPSVWKPRLERPAPPAPWCRTRWSRRRASSRRGAGARGHGPCSTCAMRSREPSDQHAMMVCRSSCCSALQQLHHRFEQVDVLRLPLGRKAGREAAAGIVGPLLVRRQRRARAGARRPRAPARRACRSIS